MASSTMQKRYVVDSVTKQNATIAASGGTDTTIDVSKNGYKPIGIVGIRKTGAGQGSTAITNFYISQNNSNNVIVSVYNLGGTERSITFIIDILYEKSA